MEVLLFLVLGIWTYLSPSVYRLQGRKITGVYTGTDFAFFRRGFECWAGHFFFSIKR